MSTSIPITYNGVEVTLKIAANVGAYFSGVEVPIDAPVDSPDFLEAMRSAQALFPMLYADVTYSKSLAGGNHAS